MKVQLVTIVIVTWTRVLRVNYDDDDEDDNNGRSADDRMRKLNRYNGGGRAPSV